MKDLTLYQTTFLSKTELSELVGSSQPSKQRQWLGEHGYLFDVRIDGTNVVLRNHIEQRLGGKIIKENNTHKKEPNVDGLLRLMNHA